MNFELYSIRPLNSNDLQEFYNLIDKNRPRLEAFFSGTVAKTRTFEATSEYLKEILTKSENKLYLPFVIEDNSSKKFIGFIDIKNIDWNIPKGELGLFIDKDFEGKKVSSKALSLFTSYCFSDLGFKKLFLRTHASNFSAKKLAEKCGFEVEGIIRRDYKTSEGELVDLLYYGKLS